MRAISDKKGKASALRLTVFGLAAGFANGLLGAGGGILIVFGMTPLITDADGQRDIFANALAVMMPVSVVSVINYMTAGRFAIDGFGVYAIPAALGGLLGAFLLSKLNIPIIKKLFAFIVIWSGLYMIFRK